jgi:hypothetical protein
MKVVLIGFGIFVALPIAGILAELLEKTESPSKAKLNFWEITRALFKNHGQEFWHCDNDRKQGWGFAVARKWNETYDGVGRGEIPPHEGLGSMLIIARGIQAKKAVKLYDAYVQSEQTPVLTASTLNSEQVQQAIKIAERNLAVH